MILIDKKIEAYGEQLIKPFSNKNIGSICYDITTDLFCKNENESLKSIELKPLESVFVQSLEVIELPKNMLAKVILRNSRIRQGIEIAAPIYQPGHKTKIFFRITNISHDLIHLDCNIGIAAVIFEELEQEPAEPYDGAFQQEFDFNGLGRYDDILGADKKAIAEQIKEVNDSKKQIYANVLAIMAIFAGVFTIANINITVIMQQINVEKIIAINFTTVGAIAFLIAVINTAIDGKHKIHLWIASVVAFLAAVLMFAILC